MVVTRIDTGQKEYYGNGLNKQPSGIQNMQALVSVHWTFEFKQWKATKNKEVMDLCQQCLLEVEQFIREGAALGYM